MRLPSEALTAPCRRGGILSSWLRHYECFWKHVKYLCPFADATPDKLAKGYPELHKHAEPAPGNRIKAILKAALDPVAIEVIDESHRHASHTHAINRNGTGTTPRGTHFRIRIVSEAFSGKTRIERHRLINHLLRAKFEEGLHALAIEAQAPGE